MFNKVINQPTNQPAILYWELPYSMLQRFQVSTRLSYHLKVIKLTQFEENRFSKTL